MCKIIQACHRETRRGETILIIMEIKMILKKSLAKFGTKNDVNMWVYTNLQEFSLAAIVYQETEKGHSEEFYHNKSTFVYYIIEGKGIWVIDDEKYEVEATDVVIILPGQRFYYTGSLKHICITIPAWESGYEHTVRRVNI
jgi:mannose-6-phosphate isomerase-like protein (cupin superfamily)